MYISSSTNRSVSFYQNSSVWLIQLEYTICQKHFYFKLFSLVK